MSNIIKKTIILCGLPGCGKTTVGNCLAEKISSSFIDVDTLIEKEYADTMGELLTCRQIFAHQGVPFFRELEKRVISSLAQKSHQDAIISIGGGAMENPENVKVLKSIGLVVYLKVNLKELFKRINRKGLPAYLDPADPLGSFEKLAQKRIPIYSNAADIEIEADSLTPEEIATKIVEKILQIGKSTY